MSIIENLSPRLARHPKRVVFPEGGDPRILQAARQFATRRLGAPILLGDRTQIKETAERLDIRLDGIRVVEPSRSEEIEKFIKLFQGLQRFHGLQDKAAYDYLADPNYFAAMMLATGGADAAVSGATMSASSAIRPFLQILPRIEGVNTISSLNILETGNAALGVDGILFLADCGVIPEPTAEQLADIAFNTATIANHLTNVEPRVAMLSYTTKNAASKNPSVSKMKTATALAQAKAKALNLDAVFDGEMQVDAALDRATAAVKKVDSSVAGRANVLIFPDLNSGNIALKLAQTVSDTRSYGQILTGFAKPVAEISRGASAHDIFGTVVIVAAQAVDRNYLFPVVDPITGQPAAL